MTYMDTSKSCTNHTRALYKHGGHSQAYKYPFGGAMPPNAPKTRFWGIYSKTPLYAQSHLMALISIMNTSLGAKNITHAIAFGHGKQEKRSK